MAGNPLFSSANRFQAPILIAAKDGNVANQLRMALRTLGYAKLITLPSHGQTLERLKQRGFPLVFFDAKHTDMTAAKFVELAIAVDAESILIAVSGNPRIDDVFNLLRLGARSFLALPFNTEGVQEIIDAAAEGPPFSESVLQAPDRNAALAGVVLNNLYRISVLMRQAREFPSAAREIDRVKGLFTESVELARMFCSDGNDSALRDRICEDCLHRATTAASRLGRTRIKLRRQREHKEGEDEEEGSTSSPVN